MSVANQTSVHTPLSQVLPWNNTNNDETVLITDTVESDGRFVLCTMVATASHQSKPVLWMCCGAMTDQLTLASLKKIGSEKSTTLSASLPDQATSFQPASAVPTKHEPKHNPRLTIRSIPALIDKAIELSHPDSVTWDEELFTKMLFGIVKDWVNDVTRANPTTGAWVVLDDVSTLAALIGEQLTYGLILSLQALVASRIQTFGLAMRCTNDNIHADESTTSTATAPTTTNYWFGGGQDDTNDPSVLPPPWERTLVELADMVVDVVPLASGYTREAHGRLYLTGRTSHVSLVYNYCLTENQVLVIRINTTTSPLLSKGR